MKMRAEESLVGTMGESSRERSNQARSQKLDDVPDEEIRELYAYGAGLQSLSDIVGLYRFSNLEFLSLHGNHIDCMQGLERLHLLKELNLSSNNIKRMEGLSHLFQLQSLNLSCNQIKEITDVEGLLALRKLLLSHNQISCLGGLSAMHGPRYSLQLLDLRDNLVSSLSELDLLTGFVNLMELIFSWGSHSNPICQAPAYKSTVIAAVPHILKLDGETLSLGPGGPCMSQGPSLAGRNLQSKTASSLQPSWALQYDCDGLQDPLLHCKEFSAHVCAEQSQPWQVFLQPQPQLPASSQHQSHQKVPPEETRLIDYAENHACLNRMPFHCMRCTPAVQPYVTHSHLKQDVRASPRIPGSSQDTICQVPEAPQWNTVSHVEKHNWVDQPSSSHLLSMHSLSHPDANKTSSELQTFCTGNGSGVGDPLHKSKIDLPPRKQTHTRFHTGRNPQAECVQGAFTVPKADCPNHEAWFEGLKEKILDLVQILPDVKTCAQGEMLCHHDNDNARASLGGSNFQNLGRSDTPRQYRRKRKGSDPECKEFAADISSGDTSESFKSRSKDFGRPLLSTGDSGSQSPECESPPRRWVQFSDKWKQKKDLTRSGRDLGMDVVIKDIDAFEHLHGKDLTRSGGTVFSTGLEGTEDRKAFKQLCEEVKNLQVGLAALTATYKGVEYTTMKLEEQPERKTELKQDDKEAVLCKLMEDCTLLESKLTNSEEKFSAERKGLLKRLEAEQAERNDLCKMLEAEQEESKDLRKRLETELEERNKLHEKLEAELEERKDLQKTFETKDTTICKLEKMLQDKDEKGQELSRQMEQFKIERGQKELCLQKKYHGKFLSLNTELVSLKEALSVATHARQNAESALLDATAEKENSRQLSLSVGQMLEDERAKLKVCKSELDVCRSRTFELQEKVDKSSKDFLVAQRQKQEALEQLSTLHKQEMEEAIAREAAAGESRGMSAAEKSLEQLRNVMNVKLESARNELQEARLEIVRIRQDMDNLREVKQRDETVLKETIRRLLLKEQGKEALLVELSSVVRSQKMKLQGVQFDLERLAEAEENLQKMHQEMIILRRRADKYDDLLLEVESLQQKLIEVTQDAERKKQSVKEQLTSLQMEKKRLTGDLEKLGAAEDAVKVKNKMLDSQNETIKELKLELSQVKEAFRKALKTSETLEAEWVGRLQIEVDQGEALQSQFANQTLIITALEEKLQLERTAKTAAEKTSQALHEKLAEKEGMFRYVEEEILQVKELYDSRVRAVGIERDQGLEKLKVAQQEKKQLEKALADAQRKQQELIDASKASQTQEALRKAEADEKDLQLAQACQRVLEVEAELKLQGLAMESQKVASVSKLDQLHKLLEEFRDGN